MTALVLAAFGFGVCLVLSVTALIERIICDPEPAEQLDPRVQARVLVAAQRKFAEAGRSVAAFRRDRVERVVASDDKEQR